MQHIFRGVLAILLGALCCAAAQAGQQEQADRLTHGVFGQVRVFRPAQAQRHVAILLSGEDGFGPLDEAMARELAAADALVLGVDLPAWTAGMAQAKGDCANTSLDLENLSKALQKRLGVGRLSAPVLVGRAQGAALVHANLVQAPDKTFLGGISLGFSPWLRLPKPLCSGKGLRQERDAQGLTHFAPAAQFGLRWQVLQPAGQRPFGPMNVRRFQAAGAPGPAGLTVLPGARLSAQARHWAGPLRQAFLRMAQPQDKPQGELADLPLVEVVGQGTSDLMALFLSGDGGWAPLDADMAEVLAEHGVWTVGINSLRYFWVRKTPEEMAEDAVRILDHYLPAWNRQRFVLVGYSLGADALPFIATRLPDHLRERLALVVLLSPGLETDLEFEVSDWVSDTDTDAARLQVLPEVLRLDAGRVLCLHGVDDTGSLCPQLEGRAMVAGLPGSHHFNGDYDGLARRTLAALGLHP